MGTRIAVAAVELYSAFTASVFLQLKKQLRAGESIVHTATDEQHVSEHATQRILSLLAGEPRPVALILIALRPAPQVVAAFRSAGLPVVIVDEEAPDASTVASDNLACGKLAAEHLLATGRRSIAIVTGAVSKPGGYSAVLRLRGFREALGAAGLALAAADVLEAPNYSHKDGVNAMNALLDRGRVDAVFCAAGDATASGMLEAARARGVKVPGEVAVLSCDDLPMAALADPPLSSIQQPIEAMAREAYRLATDARAEILERPQQVLFPPTLVRRRST